MLLWPVQIGVRLCHICAALVIVRYSWTLSPARSQQPEQGEGAG